MSKHPLVGPVSLSLGVGGWPQSPALGMWARPQPETLSQPMRYETGLNCPGDGCFMAQQALYTVKCCGLEKSYSNLFFHL